MDWTLTFALLATAYALGALVGAPATRPSDFDTHADEAMRVANS